MLTQINFNQIKGAMVNVFDYMTAAQITDVKARTAATNLSAALDVTAALQAAWTYAVSNGMTVFHPPGTYKITSGLTWLTNGSYGGGGIAGTGWALYTSGSGYTAVWIRNAVQNGCNIEVIGNGSAVNGIRLGASSEATPAPLLQSKIGRLAVTNMDGYGIFCDGLQDSTVDTLFADQCGNATYYAIQLAGTGAYVENHCHILRIQAEAADKKALYIGPNTTACVIDNIHSETAVADVAYTTWVLGGNRGQYNHARLQATVPTATNAVAYLIGAGTDYNAINVEGTATVRLEGNGGNPITLISPGIDGTCTNATGQIGLINIIGGSIATLSIAPLGFRVYGSKITTLAIGSATYNTETAIFEGCTIASLTSTDASSASTFRDCQIAEGNTLLAAIKLLNTKVTFAAASTNLSSKILNFDGATLTGTAFAINENTGGGYIRNSAIVGNFTSSASQIAKVFFNSTVTGTVAVVAPPNFGSELPRHMAT